MKKYKSLILLLLACGILRSIMEIAPPLVVAYLTKNKIITQPLNFLTISSLGIILGLVIWLPAAIWIYKDEKNNLFLGLIWLFFFLFFGFPGVIFYVLLRLLTDKENRQT
ncbi:MAG: hypothetical protein WC412_02730 [Candidatus Omnitrophota bacterium]